MSGQCVGLEHFRPLRLRIESLRGVDLMLGGAMKYIDVTPNPECEGSRPVHN